MPENKCEAPSVKIVEKTYDFLDEPQNKKIKADLFKTVNRVLIISGTLGTLIASYFLFK